MLGRTLRIRFWFESIASATGAALLALTLIAPEWIEVVFGIEPDGGNGAAEYVIASCFLAIATASALLARVEWQHVSTELTARRFPGV